MLKVRIKRAVLQKAIEYHTDEGMTVVIEDDSDLVDWTIRVLAKVSGLDVDALNDDAGLSVAVQGDAVLLTVEANQAGSDVLDAVKSYIL